MTELILIGEREARELKELFLEFRDDTNMSGPAAIETLMGMFLDSFQSSGLSSEEYAPYLAEAREYLTLWNGQPN